MSTRSWAVSLALLSSLVLCSCDRRTPLSPQVLSTPTTDRALAAGGADAKLVVGPQHEEGELGPGALYAIDIPENWNGDLVLWLHGYTPAEAAVALPSVQLRAFLLSQGFAVAASSFS